MINRIKKYSYDPEADAIYITLSNNAVSYTKSLDDTRIIDYDSNGEPRGIELLCVSHGVATDSLPFEDDIAKLLADNHVKVFA